MLARRRRDRRADTLRQPIGRAEPRRLLHDATPPAMALDQFGARLARGDVRIEPSGLAYVELAIQIRPHHGSRFPAGHRNTSISADRSLRTRSRARASRDITVPIGA